MIPIQPVEVWACGCTYEMSAAFRDAASTGTRARASTRTCIAEHRPEIFFKGTARVCVGPGQNIGIRAGFAVHGAGAGTGGGARQARGGSSGYTLANDVSAWDIERENPLYLPQSKVYTACCSLGPVIVTADEIEGSVRPGHDVRRSCADRKCFSGGDIDGETGPED